MGANQLQSFVMVVQLVARDLSTRQELGGLMGARQDVKRVGTMGGLFDGLRSREVKEG